MTDIKALRREMGISQAQLAREIGVHQTAVSQWENGRTMPDADSLKRLSDFFGVSVDAVLGQKTGKGVKIRVLGYIRAGLPVEAVEDVLDYEEITPEMAKTGEFFGLCVKGDSMTPRIYPGDIVIVRCQPDVESGDIAVVLVNGTDATVKKVIKKDTSIMLVPLNPKYEPMIFTEDEIETLPVTILGKVVELRGKF